MTYITKTVSNKSIIQTGKLVAQQLSEYQTQKLRQFLLEHGIHLTLINQHATLASLTIWDEKGFPIIAVNQELPKGRQAWELVAQTNWLISQQLWSLSQDSAMTKPNLIGQNELLHSRTIKNKDSDLPINQATIFAFTPNYQLDAVTQNRLSQLLNKTLQFNVAPLIKYQQAHLSKQKK